MSMVRGTLNRRRSFLFGSLFALAAVGGVSAVVSAQGAGGDDQAMSLDATSSPADVAEHLARMSEHIYAEVGATAEQKSRLDPIFSQASSDLAAVHAQLSGGHDQAMQLLAQDTIDRAALENLRAEHIRVADDASKRLVQLIADVGDVLTPAQRKLLVDRIAQHHAGHMAWHHG